MSFGHLLTPPRDSSRAIIVGARDESSARYIFLGARDHSCVRCLVLVLVITHPVLPELPSQSPIPICFVYHIKIIPPTTEYLQFESASSRSRTGTLIRATDFKSGVSTYFTTEAEGYGRFIFTSSTCYRSGRPRDDVTYW